MPQENSNDHNLQKVHNPMTLINPLEGNFFDNRPGDKAGNARNGAGPGGRRSKDPMEDIFGVNGGYGSPYLGTGPGTINGLDNDYDTSNSSNSSRWDHIWIFLVFPPHFPTFFSILFLFFRSQNNDKDRRGSSGSRQSPTVSGHNMNNDSDRDRNNRGPGGRDHGQNKVPNYLRLKTV